MANREENGRMTKNKPKTHVNVQIEQETKNKWVEFYKEHPEFTTTSGLVRAAVESYIKRQKEGGETSADLEDVSAKLDNLHSDVQWLRNQNESSIETLAQDLYRVLVPLPAHDSEARDEKAIRVVAFDNNQQTPTALAEKLGTTPKQIRNAIDYLKNHNFPIEQYEMEDGTLQFFKKSEES